MPYDEAQIKVRLIEALEAVGLDSYNSKEAAFHMTDWLSDLSRWEKFCPSPDELELEDLQSLLMRFLTHVPAHIAAASKLVTGIPVEDVFEVGAVSETK